MSRKFNIFILLFLLLCFVGCKVSTPLLTGSTHLQSKDSVRIEYKHDSIYIDRWHTIKDKGDTIYLHDSIERHFYHTLQKHDSIFISSTDTIVQTIEVEKKSGAFWKGSGIAFWVLLGVLVIGVAIGLIIKFAK